MVAPEFTPVFSWVRFIRSLVLCVCFVDRCLSFCTFFFLPLCCLFFDLRCLITPLVSSISSQWGSCWPIFSYQCNVLYIIVCPFVLFSFDHCVVCPSINCFRPLWYLRLTVSDLFGILD